MEAPKIDNKRTFLENLETKSKFWKELKKQRDSLEQQVASLKLEASTLKTGGKDRIRRADIQVELKNLDEQIADLDKRNDFDLFNKAVQQLLEEDDVTKEPTSTDVELLRNQELQSQKKTNDIYISISDKVKNKKKKEKRKEKENMVKVSPIADILKRGKRKENPGTNQSTIMTPTTSLPDKLFGHSLNVDPTDPLFQMLPEISKLKNQGSESSKKIAHLMKTDQRVSKEYVYCPICVIVIMDRVENPPGRRCKSCKYRIEGLDMNSPLVYEKETSQSPFIYRPWTHIKNSLANFIDQSSNEISDDDPIMVAIYAELKKRGVVNLADVEWYTVNGILHWLAKQGTLKVNPAEFYPYVYQITNKIRGAPVVEFDDDLKLMVNQMFPKINEVWEEVKRDLNIERDNSLSAPIILQVIFIFLKLPPEIVSRFGNMKSSDNEELYEEFIKRICAKFGYDKSAIDLVNTLSNIHHGKNSDVYNLVNMRKKKKLENKKQSAIEEEQKPATPIVQEKKEEVPIKDEPISVENEEFWL